MKVSAYLCCVVGERHERALRYHPATVRRLTAFALALHLPVLLWAVQGYLIARGVFSAEPGHALACALACGVVIYLMERLVLATPNNAVMSVLRLVIGLVVALLGASAVDLLIFKREIEQQIRTQAEARLVALHERQAQETAALVATARNEWLAAQAAASCEADGTCGSRVRSVGPVYRELARQAERLRADYEEMQSKAQAQRDEQVQHLQAWKASSQVLDEAGLLARVQALHDYIGHNPVAWWAWMGMFLFVLAVELIVVIAKFSFGDTIDDHLDRMRERLAMHQAASYIEAVTSPLAGARQALEQRWE